VVFFGILDRDRVIAGAAAYDRRRRVADWHARGGRVAPEPPVPAQLGD